MTPYFASKQDSDYPAINYQHYDLRDEVEVDGKIFRNEHISNKGDHHKLARKVATESTVSVVLPSRVYTVVRQLMS